MNEYVKLAKRENNNKRGFLIVNPYLGKHVPMSPSYIFNMFDDVASLIPYGMIPERTLVIGFAETATALGIHYTIKNNTYFIQTTREKVPFIKTCLYFSEEHSHATEQYIVKDCVDKIIDKIDRIIFIDDEITTGNTVLNAIKAINNSYKKEFKYDVISVLNSMNSEQKKIYSDKNIGIYFISHIDNSDYEDVAKSLISDGKYIISSTEVEYSGDIYNIPNVSYNTRLLSHGEECKKYYTEVINELMNLNKNTNEKDVLVLGTEEFMYLGLLFADRLQKELGINVKFHATTRSPIIVSHDESYPLHERYELKSVYDNDRITYIYDLKKYDKVFIISESGYLNRLGINTLIEVLENLGNKNINIITV